MEYNRSGISQQRPGGGGGGVSSPNHHQIYYQNNLGNQMASEIDDETEFELEHTAIAAFNEFDQVTEDGGAGGMHLQPQQQQQQQWGGNRSGPNAFELSPSASSFELRQYSAEMRKQYPPQQQANLSMASLQISQRSQQHQLSATTKPHQHASQLASSLSQTHSQQNVQSHVQQQPNRASSWTLNLPGAVVERNDYKEAAKFILECKGGNEAAAYDFLRGVFLTMANPAATSEISLETHDWDTAVANGPPYMTPEDQAAAQAQLVMNQHNSILLQAQRLGVPPRPPPAHPIQLINDELDQRLSTLVILVPGRAHIIGHLIGKGGAEVGRIEREMSVTIKIEAASKMSAQMMERSVCIIGSVASTTLAQQFVSHKVHEKLLSEGVQAEVLKMVVPNEIVRHLIGKSGANINRLQNESGARIQVEPESTMPHGAVGRTIVLQGSEKCRTFGQYLILRQIAEDRNVHSEWAGRLPNQPGNATGSPTSTPGGDSQSSPPSPSKMSLNGTLSGTGLESSEFLTQVSSTGAAAIVQQHVMQSPRGNDEGYDKRGNGGTSYQPKSPYHQHGGDHQQQGQSRGGYNGGGGRGSHFGGGGNVHGDPAQHRHRNNNNNHGSYRGGSGEGMPYDGRQRQQNHGHHQQQQQYPNTGARHQNQQQHAAGYVNNVGDRHMAMNLNGPVYPGQE